MGMGACHTSRHRSAWMPAVHFFKEVDLTVFLRDFFLRFLQKALFGFVLTANSFGQTNPEVVLQVVLRFCPSLCIPF